MMSLTAGANAQRNADRKVHAELHLLGGAPLGDFGKYTNIPTCALNYEKVSDDSPTNTEGAAGFVGGLGVKVTFAMPVTNLSVFVSADALIGTTKSAYKDDMDKLTTPSAAANVGTSVEITKPSYVMVPVMGGARYELNFTRDLGIYGEAGLGVAGISATSFETKYTNGSLEAINRFSYETDYTFCFQLGVGFNLGQRIRAGVSYYNLGTSQLKGTNSWEGSGTNYYSAGSSTKVLNCGKVSPSMLMANVAFIF